MPAPYHSVFYRPDAVPAAQPTASKITEGTSDLTTHLSGKPGNVQEFDGCRTSFYLRIILFGVLAVVLTLCHLNHIRLLTN